MNVSRSAVAKWETDKGIPDISNLKVMSKLLNVSIDHLLDDGESPDFGEMTEPVNLNDYEKTGKCRNKADAACLVKITKDFIKTSELTEKVSTNTFVIGSYKYRKTVFKLK